MMSKSGKPSVQITAFAPNLDISAVGVEHMSADEVHLKAI